MKKVCIVFCLLFILIATVAVSAQAKPMQSAYFRMHVRADSDSAADQEVKYKVKDAIVRFLIPVVADCSDKKDALKVVEQQLRAIERVADEVLAANGFSYTAHAEICRESFPVRVYEDVTLPSGVYDALIVNLGSGKGANWWCVIYPPLCFAGEVTGETVQYRSKLAEMIREFFARNER